MALTRLNNRSISAVTALPSGIDIPAGVILPADMSSGSVLQVVGDSVNAQIVTTVTWSANSSPGPLYGSIWGGRTYTVLQTINITPYFANSKIVCIASIGWTAMTYASTMGFGGIITLNDLTSIDNSDYPWYNAPQQLGTSGYPTSSHIQGVFSPNSTSQQTIRLRPYVYLEGGNTTSGVVRGYSLVVFEIKQ